MCLVSYANDKDSFIKRLEKEKVSGNTDFVKCFDYIQKSLKKLPDDAKVSIIFLTDGIDNINKAKLISRRTKLKIDLLEKS